MFDVTQNIHIVIIVRILFLVKFFYNFLLQNPTTTKRKAKAILFNILIFQIHILHMLKDVITLLLISDYNEKTNNKQQWDLITRKIPYI